MAKLKYEIKLKTVELGKLAETVRFYTEYVRLTLIQDVDGHFVIRKRQFNSRYVPVGKPKSITYNKLSEASDRFNKIVHSYESKGWR